MYIYNLIQANFLIEEGCKVIRVGLGNTKKVFVYFEKDTKLEISMGKWCERCDKYRK